MGSANKFILRSPSDNSIARFIPYSQPKSTGTVVLRVNAKFGQIYNNPQESGQASSLYAVPAAD